MAGMSWSTVGQGPQYDLDRGGHDLDTVAIEGWVTYAAAARILEAAGADIDHLARRAGEGRFPRRNASGERQYQPAKSN